MAFIISYDGNNPPSIVENTSSQTNDLYDDVLNFWVNTYPGRTGSLNTTGTGTTLGTFTDTSYQGADGTGDLTILSTQTTLSLVDTTQLTQDPPPNFLGLEVANNDVSIVENKSTLNDVADEILSRMVSGTYGGIGAYYIATSPPVDGGTWVQRATIDDTTDNGATLITRYYLYEKTTDTFGTNLEPVTMSVGANSEVIFEAYEPGVDIVGLSKIIEDRIVATGVGQYAFQETLPGTGSWVACGTVTDTRRQTADTGSFDSSFARVQNTSFTTTFTAGFDGSFNLTIGYASNFTGNFTGTANYIIDIYQAGYQVSGFTGYHIYTGSLYYGVGPGNFLGPSSFLGPGTYFGPLGDFTGTTEKTFAGISSIFAGVGDVGYLGDFINSDEFSGYAGASVYYVGPSSFAGSADYSSVDSTSFTGTVGDYVGTFDLGYDGAFTSAFTGNFTGTFTGPQILGTTETISTRTLWRRIG